MPGRLTIKDHTEFIFYFQKSEIDANLFTITQVKSNNKVSKVLLLIKLRLQYICTFFSELKTAKHYTLLTAPRHAALVGLVLA